MKKFEERKFNIPELKGISKKNIEEHLKLYAGYVKNANGIMEKMATLDTEKEPYIVGELFRRFSFEYNGIRNHEIYFASLSEGAKPLAESSKLRKYLEGLFGSMESFQKEITGVALTRGIGWAMVWWDKNDGGRLLASWVDEQHLGQLQGCTPILAIDMWEHAYVYDYPTSEKKKYVDAFFENLNWGVIEENFLKASAE